MICLCIQLFQLRLSPSKAEKSNTRANDLLGIGHKLRNLFVRSYSTFPLCSGTTLIKIAVCSGGDWYTATLNLTLRKNFNSIAT